MSSLGGQLDEEVLRNVSRNVAAQISVGPGMEATMKAQLAPALWQPIFLICIGSGQVRVITCAFVGEPVTGDRPDCKCTPYILRLATSDLMAEAKGAKRDTTSVRCLAVQSEGAQSILEYLTTIEDQLFAATVSGRWSSFLQEKMPEPEAVAHDALDVRQGSRTSTGAEAMTVTPVTMNGGAVAGHAVHRGHAAVKVMSLGTRDITGFGCTEEFRGRNTNANGLAASNLGLFASRFARPGGCLRLRRPLSVRGFLVHT